MFGINGSGKNPFQAPHSTLVEIKISSLGDHCLANPQGSFQNPGYLFPALTGRLEQLQNIYQFIVIYFSFGTKAPSAWTLWCFRSHFNPGKTIPIDILTETLKCSGCL